MWPQYILIALSIFGMGVSVARYGQPKKDSYDLVDVLIGPVLVHGLLYLGGFYNGFFQ